MSEGEMRFDVVVVGGGLSGLTAAVRAAEHGRTTLLLEKAATVGGSWQYSGGVLWTARTPEDMRRVMPNGDPALGRVLTERFDAAIRWLGTQGVPVGEKESPLLGFGHGYRLPGGPAQLLETLTAAFRARGGTVWTQAPVHHLLEEDGAVRGVVVRRDARLVVVRAGAVVLCSGGFSANTEMLTRYVGRWADRLLTRSHAGNTGDGFQMALRLGAATSRSLANFYGHLVPAPPAVIPPESFRDATFYGSIHAIVVNLAGQRFVDESVYDATTALALAHQPEARGVLLFDGAAERHEREEAGTARPGATLRERADLAKRLGGQVATGATLDELFDTLAGWGVHREGLAATVAQYNRAVADDSISRLPVRRGRLAHALAVPPFTAVAVTAAVTFTMGGLRADERARVLDRQGEPIEGLFAAGTDAGGVFYDRYAGGGAWAVVSGLLAADDAAAVG